ncbi:MAG: DUF6263 family protein [Planctomycetaceae bacterium]
MIAPSRMTAVAAAWALIGMQLIASEDTPTTENANPVAEAPEKTADSPAAVESSMPSAETENAAWILRYQFQQGQKLRYQMEQKMTLEANLGERGQQIDRSALRQRRVFTATSVHEDRSAEFTMQFENVWMQKQVDDNAPVEFDSSMKPGEVPLVYQQVAHQLKGSAPRYVLTQRGLSKKSPETPSKVERASAEKSSEPLVESDSASNPVQLASSSTVTQKQQGDPGSFLATLPEHEVRVGDTWKEQITVTARLQEDINVEVPILRTFRLDSVDDGIASISFHCSIQSRVRSPIVKGQLIQATPKGTIQIDTKRGLMLRRENIYDTSVFGALGQNTILTCVGRSTEELIEDVASSSEQAGK